MLSVRVARAGAPLPAEEIPVRKGRRDRRAEFRRLWRRLAYLGCAAGLALVAGAHSAQVAREGQSYLALKEELSLLEAENRRLEAQVVELQSPARIEREAVGRLGMVRPPQVAPVPPAPVFAGGGPGRIGSDRLAVATTPSTVSIDLPAAADSPAGSRTRTARAEATTGTGLLADPAGLGGELIRRLSRWLAGR